MTAAWAAGRSTVIGTLRSSSHGHAAQATATTRSHTAGSASRAAARLWSWRWPAANCTVLTDARRRTAHPQKRCVSSKRSCAEARRPGRAITLITTSSATQAYDRTTVAVDTSARLRERSRVSEATKSAYHAVPATAVPTWRPPKWYHLASAQRSRSGHDVGGSVATQPSTLMTHGWRRMIASERFT